MPSRLLPSVLLLLALAGSCPAGPTVLELIPADAGGALFVRNLAELRKKGDAFLKEIDWDERRWGRPSQLVDFVLSEVALQGIADEKRPMGLIAANPQVLKTHHFDSKLFVLVIPFTDKKKVAGRFEIEEKDLKEGEVFAVKQKGFGHFVYLKGDYFYLAQDRKALFSVLEGKPFAATLTSARRKQLAEADMLLHLGPTLWEEMWNNVLKEAERTLTREDKEITQPVLAALKRVRYGVITLRVDRGLGFGFHTAFAEEDRKLLTTFLAGLRAGSGTADLKGLPVGNLLFAEGARGEGSKSTATARAMFEVFLRELVYTREVVAAADRHNVVAVFSAVWSRLKGHRVGVYLTHDEKRLGLTSAVAILDTGDAEKFLSEMQLLARLGDPTALHLDIDKGKKEDLAEVNRLIRNLGADEFFTREEASAKLGLLGESAVPHLKKALESSRDAEVRRRARLLIARAEGAAAQRRKDLLSGKFKYRLRPSFTYYPGAEERLGYRVDVVGVNIDRKDEEVVRRLQGLFGPHWDKIRLAVHGQQVVVLVGSDVSLFEQALGNLKDNKPGLAATPELAGNTRMLDPARKLEYHIALQRGYALLGQFAPGVPVLKDPGPEVTSLALSVDADALHLGVWIPTRECRPVLKLFGW
jgi:hypothetical protein